MKTYMKRPASNVCDCSAPDQVCCVAPQSLAQRCCSVLELACHISDMLSSEGLESPSHFASAPAASHLVVLKHIPCKLQTSHRKSGAQTWWCADPGDGKVSREACSGMDDMLRCVMLCCTIMHLPSCTLPGMPGFLYPVAPVAITSSRTTNIWHGGCALHTCNFSRPDQRRLMMM